jgi:hypothetical protein
MALSMSVRHGLAAVLLLVVAGCGGDSPPPREVRLLAPADLAGDATSFERRTGCRVDLRVYDAGEDLSAIARRRNVDVVAGPVPPGLKPHDSVELVRITLDRGLEVTVPKHLAAAFDKPTRPAGRRSTRWTIRRGAGNLDCARRWVSYATSDRP